MRIALPETLEESTKEWKKGSVKNSLGKRSSQTDSFNYRDIGLSQHTEIDPNMHEDIDQKLVQKPLVDTHSGQFAVNFFMSFILLFRSKQC